MSQTPTACARLADELQALRHRAGLSLAALAARTPFSKSSWARYLNGKALPPWSAVQALCTLAEEPQAEMRALWRLAEDAWSRRGAVTPASVAVPAPAPAPAPTTPAPTTAAAQPSDAGSVPVSTGNGPAASVRRPWRIIVVTAGALLSGAALLAVGTQPWRHVGGSDPSDVAASAAPAVGCEGRTCDGGDPTGMDCGVYPGPVSLAGFQTRTGAELEIRYNPRCQAAWARVRLSRTGDEISISLAGKDTRTAVIPDQYSAETYVDTPMVPTTPHGQPLVACLTPPQHGHPECFSVHQP